MEIVWYIIIMGMLVTYFVLDGYDFGAGIVQLFFSKSQKEKETVYKVIGPFWDANEVWLIAGGGTLFCAFPLVYASAFSGFYLPLIMVLWLLIFRAISIELRHHVHSELWYAIWNKAFGLSSMLLALFFGVALGNVVRGVNLGMVENGKLTQEANYFFLPLWNESFSPTNVFQGVLDWFTVIIGIIYVITLCIHGANWIILKSDSAFKKRLKKIVPKLTIVLSVFIIISIALWTTVKPNAFENYVEHPIFFLFPIITLVGLLGLFGTNKYKKDSKGFLFSSLFIIGGIASSVASIFPNLLPSTNNINESLTIYNTAAPDYGLSTAIVWWSIAMVLVVFYFVVQHYIFKGKIDHIDYE